jgi:putative heme iron utilization protein
MSLALILVRAKRQQEAIVLFEKARSLGQDSPAGLRFYSELLLSVGQRDKAEALLTPLSERGTVKASAFTGALARVRSGDKGNVAINVQDHVAIGLLTLVEAMKDSRPPTETSDLLSLLAFLHPTSDEVSAALGQHLASHGYDELAEPYLTRVSSVSPDFVATRTELAWLVYARDPKQALLEARGLAAKYPSSFAALTLLADAKRIETEVEDAAERYYRHFPEARGYHRTHGFEFWQLALKRIRFIGGFGAIHWLEPAELLAPNPFSVTEEAGMVAHMNEDHTDAMRDYLRPLLGDAVGSLEPTLAGVDGEGIHIKAGLRVYRMPFPAPVTTAREVRGALVELAKRCRASRGESPPPD